MRGGRADPYAVSATIGGWTYRDDLEAATMTSDQPLRPLYTSSQAARHLGVSLATVRRWADAGHLAYYRTPGGQRRFSAEQLESFMTSMHQPMPVPVGAPVPDDDLHDHRQAA